MCEDDETCTCCDDTGITIQTERRCSCRAGIALEPGPPLMGQAHRKKWDGIMIAALQERYDDLATLISTLGDKDKASLLQAVHLIKVELNDGE